jgi:hypothetical protein
VTRFRVIVQRRVLTGVVDTLPEVADEVLAEHATFNVDGTVVFRDAASSVLRAYAPGAWVVVCSDGPLLSSQ